MISEKIVNYLINYPPRKTKKVKVTASVTYSKSLEVEVGEDYSEVDLREAVRDLGVLPNDILTEEHARLRKHIRKLETKDWILKETMENLISERDKHSPWHEDEFEVIEEY